jgi:hypothetical protein
MVLNSWCDEVHKWAHTLKFLMFHSSDAGHAADDNNLLVYDVIGGIRMASWCARDGPMDAPHLFHFIFCRFLLHCKWPTIYSSLPSLSSYSHMIFLLFLIVVHYNYAMVLLLVGWLVLFIVSLSANLEIFLVILTRFTTKNKYVYHQPKISSKIEKVH